MEGFYVESQGIIYSVKGVCDYDPNFLLVVPKYAKTGCVKVNVNCNLGYIKTIGVRSCVILKDEISMVYNPFEYSIRRLPARIRKFIEYIEQNIINGEVGLSGSYLLGCPSPSSDVDLVIKGYSLDYDYNRLVSALKYRNECDDSLIIRNYKEKIIQDRSMSLKDYLRIFKTKVLEGCFDGILYSIRFLEDVVTQEICGTRFLPIGKKIVLGRLKHVKPYTTPSLYLLIDKYTGQSYNLMSWRIRYSELPEGYYIVEGDLFIDSKSRLWIIPDHTGWIGLL